MSAFGIGHSAKYRPKRVESRMSASRREAREAAVQLSWSAARSRAPRRQAMWAGMWSATRRHPRKALFCCLVTMALAERASVEEIARRLGRSSDDIERELPGPARGGCRFRAAPTTVMRRHGLAPTRRGMSSPPAPWRHCGMGSSIRRLTQSCSDIVLCETRRRDDPRQSRIWPITPNGVGCDRWQGPGNRRDLRCSDVAVARRRRWR